MAQAKARINLNLSSLKLSPITVEQWKKVAKAAVYSFVSAVLAGLVVLDNPFSKEAIFAVVVSAFNTALVTVKQAFTK